MSPPNTATGDLEVVVRLDGTHNDPSLLGGKGAALDRLVGWGIRVPPTAVVTANAFRLVWDQPSLEPLRARLRSGTAVAAAEIDAAVLAAGLPKSLLPVVVDAATAVAGGRPIAIRSSATVEDLGNSSFAGQYRSLLGIDAADADSVERAVLLVFASLFHPAPRAYRAALGVDDTNIAMAAVLMQMVDAQRAGVVFTQDPTVAEPTIRIETVDGLGESLVSGKRTPRIEQVGRMVDADGIVRMASPGTHTDELAAIVSAALDIERRCGTPQDIEWAQDDSGLWIVQARPVTALRSNDRDPFGDDPLSLGDAELTTEGIGEMLPGVLPPLIWTLASHVVEEGFRTMLARLGADVAAAEGSTWLLRRVRGRAALDLTRLEQLMAGVPGGAARVRAAYFGEQRATAKSEHALAARIRAARARRTASFDADVVSEALLVLGRSSTDLAALDHDVLLARHRSLLLLAARAVAAELTVSADAGAIHAGAYSLLARHLDAGAAAHWADLLTVPDMPVVVSNASSAAVFAGPTWSELGIEPPPPKAPFDRGAAFANLATALEGTPHWPRAGLRRRLARRRIEHVAERAAHQFARREQTKATILSIGGLLRSVHQELARRLAAIDAMGDRSDIDLLTMAEVRSLLAGATMPSRRDLMSRRRSVQRHLTFEPLPSHWRGMPPEHSASSRPGATLTGWAASGGRFVGVARRVESPLGKIASNEVLVAAETDPSWSPLLLRCGALVLERGGPLSHAAILAREFGVPAVLNLPGAAHDLDGKRILVDGDAGTVTVLDNERVSS